MKRSPSFQQRAQTFWQSRQQAAGDPGYSGYLLDESPAFLGQRRFEGEWSDFVALSPKGRACLDLGCGTGLWLPALARRFERVEGWDYAPSMVAAARRRLKGLGLANARVRLGDIRQRQGRALFDCIFVGGVIMYTHPAELPSLLAALKRLLKPGGRLILRESTRPEGDLIREGQALRPGLLAKRKAPEDYVAIYRSPQSLRAALALAGFSILKEAPNRHYHFSELMEEQLRRLPLSPPQLWAWRWLTLWPLYLLRRPPLRNRWFVCSPST